MAKIHQDKSIPTHKSVILAGKFIKKDDQIMKQYNSISLLRHFYQMHCKAGDYFTETLTNKKPKRSEQQNNYYYLYLSLIGTSSGHSIEELAIWAKGKFLSKGITEVFGDKTRIVESSADLNRDEFTEFLNRIEESTGIPLPDPKPFNLGLTLDEYGKLKKDQVKKYKKMKAKGLPKKKP
ncbi:hypothetical protein LCGC14_1071680 [marine sediment metagenome]|uniref:Uncharacterized protein n=1 Tax=marine sediment metagenome TaxID=412755 RepID=A0A0F9QNV2_9ZZZZ